MSKKNGKASAAGDLHNERIASFVPPYARKHILEDIEQWERELEENGDSYRKGDEDDQGWLELIAKVIATLERVGSDERMKKAYEQLRPIFADDYEESRWVRFVCACQDALSDFSYEAWLLDEAKSLRKDIVSTANQLFAQMLYLEEISGFGDGKQFDKEKQGEVNWPDELFSAMADRRYITGKTRRDDWWGLPRVQVALPHALTNYQLSSRQETRRALRLFVGGHWLQRRLICIRPSEIVELIRDEAKAWEPEIAPQSSPAEVVFSSQKKSTKMRTIRAFWYALTWRRHSPYRAVWKKDAKMMRAVAQVCDVILNDPNDSVSYDDVKYALKIFDQRNVINPPQKRRIRPVN